MAESVNTESTPIESDDSLNIKDILYQCLAKWYWFVISLAICVGYTYWNLLKQPDVYTRTAKVQIKERGGTPYYYGEFNMNLYNSGNNLQDELAHMKSPDIIREVVKRLHLEMNYSTKGRFHDNVLYGTNLPVNAVIEGVGEDDYAGFEITSDSKGNITLSGFYGPESTEKDLKTTVKTKLNSTVNTPIGKITVMPTEYYKPKAFDIKVNRGGLKGTTGMYTGKLQLEIDPTAKSIVKLSSTDVSPERAEDFLNMVLNVYNQKWMDDKNQIAISTSKFIDERLAVIEKELGNVDTDISSYKSSNLITDVDAASSMYMDQANKASREIQEINHQIFMARHVRNYLTDSSRKFELLPANSGFESSSLSSEISAYNANMLKRNTLLANSNENNPIIQEMDENLEKMRQSMIQSIDNVLLSLNAQIKTAQQTEGRAVAHIASNPQQAKYLLTVERQQKVKESLYLFLLQKREDNELSQAFTAYNTRLVSAPAGSSAPTGPNRQRSLLISFLIGLAVPFVIIFLLDFLNSKVRGRLDLEKLSAPFLGEIPTAKGMSKGPWWKRILGKKDNAGDAGEILIHKGNRNIINEAFRVLRTNLDLVMSKSPTHNVIAVTSFNPGSGKSFITMNLSVAIAIRNRRVLVIDGDLRHASLSKYVGSPRHGLSDYLAGRVDDLQSLIVQLPDHPSLDVLPVGKIPPNPTELLEDPRLHAMLDALRTQYAYIFIDCPPIDVVADTQIIERQSDRTIFVIRAGVLERSMIVDLENIYRTKRLKNLSIVLNGTEATDSKYGYKYSYKYGYYGYGGSSYYTNEG